MRKSKGKLLGTEAVRSTCRAGERGAASDSPAYDSEEYVETIEINVVACAPPPELEQSLENAFMKQATVAGAINMYIQKSASHWNFVADFLESEKAAAYAARMSEMTGLPVMFMPNPSSSSRPN